MQLDGKIWVGQGDNPCYLLLNQANRHGVVTGASGTGKTVTLKVMAEGFSSAGVPVFLADVKGDVTGIAQAGVDNEGMQKRIAKFGIEGWSYRGCPTRLWTMDPERPGLPVRITVSDFGPELLARMLGLSDVQEGVLNVVFRIADDRELLLVDLKDLRALLNYVAENAKEFELDYGRVAPQSVSAIVRALIEIEDQGANEFFGEPALELDDWFACAPDGRGYVNLLDAVKLIQNPKVYAMFLLWMLSELFEKLPEVGDLDKPKFVFFFDEAHLLFDGMPAELTDKVIQVVKLIRSKGVGVYFISQSPSDIPNEVLAQLSNRIQHGLRAYTPAEQKAVKAAAAAFRENPAFDSQQAILELGTGEALISFLDEDGRPSMVENAKVLPPQCLMAPASAEVMEQLIADQAGLHAKYGTAVDRQSAYEVISEERKREAEADALAEERAKVEAERLAFEKEKLEAELKAQREAEKAAEKARKEAEKAAEKAQREAEREAERKQREREKMAKQVSKKVGSVLESIGKEAGKQILRGLFGTRK